MKVFQPKEEESKFGRLTKRCQRALEKATIIKIVLTSVSFMMDLSKDILILIQISFSQGHFALLMGQPTPYIKWVYVFWNTVTT